MRRALVIGAFGFLTALPVAAPVLAAEYGGPGGSAFAVQCGARLLTVGVRGRAGAVIDAVGLVCAELGLDGKRRGPLVETPLHGGPGGSAFSLLCPEDQAVIGLGGRAGAQVDALSITCGTIIVDYRRGGIGALGSGVTLGPVGGAGGQPFSLPCGVNPLLEGLRGRSSRTVHAIVGVNCLHHANKGIVHDNYRVTITITPPGPVVEGATVQVSWAATGGPPASLPSAPRFKVDLVPPARAGSTPGSGLPAMSPVPSWASLGLGYTAETGRALTLDQVGTWRVFVSAVPYREDGRSMAMFEGKAAAAIEVKPRPVQPASPGAPSVPPGSAAPQPRR